MMSPQDFAQGALDAVGAQRGEIVRFAKELIAAPSPNPPGDEQAAASVAERELRGLGFSDIQIVGPRPERANLLCCYDTGRPGPTLILNGHLDTKPPVRLAEWRTDPYEGVVEGGRLYGLGAADMKGPDAALAYGLAAAVGSGASLRGKVILALTADEEGQAMDGPRYLVQDLGLSADAVLVAEPCGVDRCWETLPLISRGFCGLRFSICGTGAHSSISDRVGARNATVDAARLLVFLQDNLKLTYPRTPLCPGGPTVNMGTTFQGGQGLGFVPDSAWFTANIRTLPGMTRESLAADVDAAVSAFRQESPHAQVSWRYFEGNLAWTTPTEIAADTPLVGALRRASARVLGFQPPLGYFPGGTDAIWWQGQAGIPTVPAFGPGLLTVCHAPNEWVGVGDLIEAAGIYALAVLDYLGQENP